LQGIGGVQGAIRPWLSLYPGNAHLFCDSSLTTHDAEATELMTDRIVEFLADR